MRWYGRSYFTIPSLTPFDGLEAGPSPRWLRDDHHYFVLARPLSMPCVQSGVFSLVLPYGAAGYPKYNFLWKRQKMHIWNYPWETIRAYPIIRQLFTRELERRLVLFVMVAMTIDKPNGLNNYFQYLRYGTIPSLLILHAISSPPAS